MKINHYNDETIAIAVKVIELEIGRSPSCVIVNKGKSMKIMFHLKDIV